MGIGVLTIYGGSCYEVGCDIETYVDHGCKVWFVGFDSIALEIEDVHDTTVCT